MSHESERRLLETEASEKEMTTVNSMQDDGEGGARSPQPSQPEVAAANVSPSQQTPQNGDRSPSSPSSVSRHDADTPSNADHSPTPSSPRIASLLDAKQAFMKLVGGLRTPKERPTTTKAILLDLDGARTLRDSDFGGSSYTRSRSSSNPAAERASAVYKILTSMNFLKTHISFIGKAFALWVILISMLSIAMCLTLEIVSLSYDEAKTISDSTACNQATFKDIGTNTLAYNAANIALSALFMVWYSLRAVRLEKEWLLFCFFVVSMIQIGRQTYLAFWVLRDTALSPGLIQAFRVVTISTSCFVVVAWLMALRVYHTFGWRLYSKGVTKSDHVRQIRQYKQFDACLKLDVYLCCCMFLTLYFSATDDFMRIYGFVATVLTLASFLTVARGMKKNIAVVVYVFFLVALLLPTIYLFNLISLFDPPEEACFRNDLVPCTSAANISLNATFDVVYPPSRYIHDRASWRPDNCVPYNMTEWCFQRANESLLLCCQSYGQCSVKYTFRKHDQDLSVALAVLGLGIRLITIALGFREMKAMNLPTMRELFRRGESNLRNSLSFLVADALRRPGPKSKPDPASFL